MLYRSIIILLFCFFPLVGWGWNNNGHMLIAEIAYENLTPPVKTRVDELSALLGEYYPYNKNAVRAAVWADWLKGSDVRAFDHWHYIDLPFADDGTQLPTSSDQYNIVWAIGQSQKVLQSRRSNDFEKALFLRFFIHFVGDIHQPLHCITRVSRQYPRGDRGGNKFTVISPYGNNLHRVWDQGVGYLKISTGRHLISRKKLQKMAKSLQQAYPKSDFKKQLAMTNPKDWANEGFEIGKNIVYTLDEGSVISKDYQTRGQLVVKQRVTLAGYRLAEALNQLLG